MRGIIAWNQKVILGILPRFLFPKEFLCSGAVAANPMWMCLERRW